MSTFSRDERVYDGHGNEYFYSGMLEGVHYLKAIYERFDPNTQDEYECVDSPQPFHDEIFRDPPTTKKHGEIERLQGLVGDLKGELNSKRDELRELTRQIEEVQAKAQEYAEFQLLLDYLDGKVTHVVADESILTLEDALTDSDSWSRESWPCAVGLFSAPNPFESKFRGRKVEWKRSKYRDGSGGWRLFTPCRSEEEAKRTLVEEFEATLNDWRAKKAGDWVVRRFLDQNPWIEAPEDFLEAEQACKERSREKRRAELEAELNALGASI